MHREMTDLGTVIVMEVKMGIIVREMVMVILEIEDKTESFRGNLHGKGRGRGRFDKSPKVKCPRVASKTVDKDKMRCHYCNEFGHFIRGCSKINRDEKEAIHFNGMSSDYYEDDVYTGEDYDDEVFATLNS